MTEEWHRRAFRAVRAHLPRWVSSPIKRLGTALLTPVLFSWRTGHLRSSFKLEAVSRFGDPLPWYTYPCIDFLTYRPYERRTVLEFGAGQSTLWWAKRAKRIVAFEGDEAWFLKVKGRAPSNVELHLVPVESPSACVEAVNRLLSIRSEPYFDVVVIDGLWRYEMIDIAIGRLTDKGIIICDNAEGYGVFEGFRRRDFERVDFFGNAPGVVLPHCTSVFFRPGSFVFDPDHPIPAIARER